VARLTREVLGRDKTTLTRKNNKIYPYILAVVCTTAFFAFEYIPDKSLEYLKAKQNYTKAKKKRTVALTKLKKYAEETSFYKEYLIEKKRTDEAWTKLNIIKENDTFLGFTNLQQFLGEFGWVLGLFMYSLFNLFRSYTANNKEKGKTTLFSRF